MARLLILLLALVALPAAAGIRATYAVEEDEPALVEIGDNGDVSADMGWGDRLIVRAGQAFIVDQRLTGPLVMRVEDVAAIVAEREAAHADDRRPPPIAGLGPVRQGQEEVNGRSGQAWYSRNAEGAASDHLVAVISDDPALAGLAPAMRHLFDAQDLLIQLTSNWPPEMAAGEIALRRVLEDGAPLIFGRWSLRAVEQAAIDPSRFALPGEPETREAMRARLAAEEARPRRSDHRMISRAVFAGGRLWLLTDTGHLSSLAEGERTTMPHDPGEEVLDLCERGDAPVLLTGRPDAEAWTVRRLEDGRWRTVRSVAAAGDYLVAMACGDGRHVLLTNRRVIDLERPAAEALALTDELPPGRVNSAVHIRPEAVLVGVNHGEWGGGLRRIDRRSGRVETIERNATGDLCDGPLNTDCDPVHSVVTLPWRPECAAAAVGLIHMRARGRIVSICPDGIAQIFAAADGIDPEDAEQVAEAAEGGSGSVAFFGLAVGGDALIAAGHDGLYRIDADGAAVHEPWPRFIRVDGILVSFALPDLVLVMTEINRRASGAGAAPLLVVR